MCDQERTHRPASLVDRLLARRHVHAPCSGIPRWFANRLGASAGWTQSSPSPPPVPHVRPKRPHTACLAIFAGHREDRCIVVRQCKPPHPRAFALSSLISSSESSCALGTTGHPATWAPVLVSVTGKSPNR